MTSNPSPRSEDSLITASKPMGDTLISATFTMSRKQWQILRSHLQEARDRDHDEHVALRIVRDIYRILNKPRGLSIAEAPVERRVDNNPVSHKSPQAQEGK